MSTITYTVTVASAKFLIDDAVAPKLTFRDGDTYEFDQADSTNSGHILQFSITSNGSGGAEYTTGITKTGTPGSAGAKTTIITSTSTTDTLYYYSSGGGTYGEEFSNSGFNTNSDNILKPIVGAESTAEKWGPMINHSLDQLSELATAADTSTVQTASKNLTGTITDSYFLSLAYVLTGDVTFSGNVILGKMVDGTTNISITNDGSTRTLSGSGTVTFNNVLFN